MSLKTLTIQLFYDNKNQRISIPRHACHSGKPFGILYQTFPTFTLLFRATAADEQLAEVMGVSNNSPPMWYRV